VIKNKFLNFGFVTFYGFLAQIIAKSKVLQKTNFSCQKRATSGSFFFGFRKMFFARLSCSG
jgi:hypothetical protein